MEVSPIYDVSGTTAISAANLLFEMKSSLISREVIADSAELTVRGHCYDALVGIAGCDKSLPGLMMSMLRLNVPSVFIYGGSILPGKFKGKDVTVVDVFEAVGKHS